MDLVGIGKMHVGRNIGMSDQGTHGSDIGNGMPPRHVESWTCTEWPLHLDVGGRYGGHLVCGEGRKDVGGNEMSAVEIKVGVASEHITGHGGRGARSVARRYGTDGAWIDVGGGR